MTKYEFMDNLKEMGKLLDSVDIPHAPVISEIPDKIYENIERVYTFFPCISNTSGKKEIAILWLLGGHNLIKQLLPQTIEIERLEREIEHQRFIIQDKKRELERIKGNEV